MMEDVVTNPNYDSLLDDDIKAMFDNTSCCHSFEPLLAQLIKTSEDLIRVLTHAHTTSSHTHMVEKYKR